MEAYLLNSFPCSFLFFFNFLQLAISKRGEENIYDIDGTEALGSYLRLRPCSEKAPELFECSFQWYCLTSEGKKGIDFRY